MVYTYGVMTARPKIKQVVLIRNAMPYDFGGAERYPVDLATELGKHGWQTLVVSRSAQLLDYSRQQAIPAKSGWWWSHQDWSGKQALLFPVYLGWQMVLTGWYVRLFLHMQPAVVHIQSKDDFIAATWATKLLRRRVIWTDHADLKYIYANHKTWYKNPVGKLVYATSRLADAITLVSHSEQRLVSAALGKTLSNHYVVVPNGVVDRAVTPYAGPLKKVGSFTFCATSRLVTAKGIGELIDAFALFVQKNPEAQLWLVGDGPEADKFKKQAGDTPGITFFGHSDTPLEFVASSDVFVHPSYHEGFSISLIEAAMLSKPIVACNVGGNPEIVHDHETGLLIPEKNASALLAAMETLYNQPSLAANLGAGARQLYEKDYQFDKIVTDTLLPLYENH